MINGVESRLLEYDFAEDPEEIAAAAVLAESLPMVSDPPIRPFLHQSAHRIRARVFLKRYRLYNQEEDLLAAMKLHAVALRLGPTDDIVSDLRKLKIWAEKVNLTLWEGLHDGSRRGSRLPYR